MRLFLADDSEVLRSRISQLISGIKGIEIAGEAGTVSGALEAVESLKPDVVVLDIRMPGGDSLEALQKMKKMDTPPMVIIFTSYPYLQLRRKCLNAGADHFFYKATEFGRLIELLKDLV